MAHFFIGLNNLSSESYNECMHLLTKPRFSTLGVSFFSHDESGRVTQCMACFPFHTHYTVEGYLTFLRHQQSATRAASRFRVFRPTGAPRFERQIDGFYDEFQLKLQVLEGVVSRSQRSIGELYSRDDFS